MNDRKLAIETLEDRRMLATFTVTNLLESGLGSLRQAIISANNAAGADTITFSGAGSSGTISLFTGELAITGALTITGPLAPDGSNRITINAGRSSRIFNIDNPSSFTENFNVTLANLTLLNGQAVGEGGAIRSMTLGTVAIQNSTISGSVAANDFENSIYGAGGGIYAFFSTLNISDSRVTDNYAYTGGGVLQHGGAMVITRSTIDGNESSYSGGIDVFDVNLEITDSTISNNTSFGLAGGISINSSTGTIKNSTISGNVAAVDGGGVDVRNSSATIIGSTISNNHADGLSGGINRSGSTSALTLKNTIVAGNSSGPNGPDIGNSGLPAGALNVNYTLIGDTSGLTAGQLSQINSGAGNLLNVDADLGTLANNGGKTVTHALGPDSPALNAGDPADHAGVPPVPAADQRGGTFSRVVGGRIDMGAYEEQNIVAPINADFDHDEDVDGDDFLLWQRGFPGTYDSSHLAAWEQQYALPVAISALSQGSSTSPFWIFAPGDGETANVTLSVIEEDTQPVETVYDEAFAALGADVPQPTVAAFGEFCVHRRSETQEDDAATDFESTLV